MVNPVNQPFIVPRYRHSELVKDFQDEELNRNDELNN